MKQKYFKHTISCQVLRTYKSRDTWYSV